MQKTLCEVGRKALSVLSALALALALVPAVPMAAQTAYADDADEIREGDAIDVDIPFEPSDTASEATTATVNCTVTAYDLDTKTGQVSIGAAKGKTYPGKLSIPETVSYKGSKLTITSTTKYGFQSHSELKNVDLPDTLVTLGDACFNGCTFDKLVIPASVTTWGGRYMQGGMNSSSAGTTPVFEWKGNTSEITSSRDRGGKPLVQYAGGKRIDHIFWGDAGLESVQASQFQFGPHTSNSAGAIIQPQLLASSSAWPSEYLWFPVTYYTSQADALAGKDSVGTAYVSFSKGQTNSSTMALADLKKQSRVTYGDVANMTLKGSSDTAESGNSYFLNYNDGTRKTLTDYPSLPDGCDKWMIVGNPNPNSNINHGISVYPVKTDNNDLGQGYYEGLSSEYMVTGSDIEPALKIYDASGNEVSSANYSISYQRKDGDNWVDATEAGQHGSLYATYRMVISGKGTYTGSITSTSYYVRGYKTGETMTYPVKHVGEDGSQDTIDCRFKVTEAATDSKAGILAIGEGVSVSATNYTTAHAIDPTVTGSIEIPGTIDLLGMKYTVTAVSDYAFGTTGASYSCKITGCSLPDTITSIGQRAFMYVPLKQAVIPPRVTTMGSNAYYMGDKKVTSVDLKSVRFTGDASGITAQKTSPWYVYTYMDLLFDGDTDFSDNADKYILGFMYKGYKKWCKVDYYDFADADAPSASVYVEQGTRVADVIAGTAPMRNASNDEASVPALPLGANAWTLDARSSLGQADVVEDGGTLKLVASSASATSLSTARVSGMEGEYWYTGSDINPTFTLTAADGNAISADKYTVSYELKDGDAWKAAGEGERSAEGSYRLVIKPAAGSGLSDELSVGYKVARPAPKDKISYPVDNVLPSGETQKVDMTFEVVSVGEGSTHGVLSVGSSNQNYQGSLRAIAYDVQGSVDIPATVTLGNSIYDVTSIGGKAFYGFINMTGVNIPEGITAIGGYAFDTASLKQVVFPTTLSTIGDYAFAMTLNTKTSSTAQNNAYGTIEEVVFKGPARYSASQPTSAGITLSSSQRFCNVKNTGSFLFEGETANRTIKVSTSTTDALSKNIYMKVTYSENLPAYEYGESMASVFVKKGTAVGDISSGLYSGAYSSAEIPSLPSASGADGKWIYVAPDGSTLSDESTVDMCLGVYASSPSDSLFNCSFKNAFNDITYPWTGSAVSPDYGAVLDKDGQTIDESRYLVKYQCRTASGAWATDARGNMILQDTAVKEGTYRIVITPADDTYADYLWSKQFNIVKTEDPTVESFKYPVKFVSASGQVTYYNGTFMANDASSVRTYGIAGDYDAEGVPSLTAPAASGDFHLPSSVAINGSTLKLTCLGTASFAITSEGSTIGLHIPSTVTKLEARVYTGVESRQNAYPFSKVYYDGDANIAEMGTGNDYGWNKNASVQKSQTHSVIFSGKLSSYLAGLTTSDKGHFLTSSGTTYGTAYGTVRCYESKQAYESGADPIATPAVKLGTSLVDVSAASDGIDCAPGTGSLPEFDEVGDGGSNFWQVVNAVDSAGTVQDGTVAVYACQKDATDFARASVELANLDYVATGDAIDPQPTVHMGGDTLDASAYTISYERLQGSTWSATDDLKSTGTLRAVATAASGSGYTGFAVSAAYTIHGITNEAKAYFNGPAGYLPNGTDYTPDTKVTQTVMCSYQILKAATADECGYVTVARSSAKSEACAYGTAPCVSESLDGTLVIPESIKTDQGEFKVIAVGQGIDPGGSSYRQGVPFRDCNLTGLVYPKSMDLALAKELTSTWWSKASNVISITNNSSIKKVYFLGDMGDYQLRPADSSEGGKSSKAVSFVCYGDAIGIASGGTGEGYLGVYQTVRFFGSKADAASGSNELGSARVLRSLTVASLNEELNTVSDDVVRDGATLKRYSVWQDDGGKIPGFPEGMGKWKALGNAAYDVTVADASVNVYAVKGDSKDLAEATFYNPGVKENPQQTDSPLIYTLFTDSKTYDGKALGTEFVIKDADGNIVPDTAYETSFERQAADGTWSATEDFSSMGKFRITVTAKADGEYTGSASITCSVKVGKEFTVDMPYQTDDAAQGTLPVNLSVVSVDEGAHTITANIAPTADGDKAAKPDKEGKLTLLSEAVNGSYTIHITKVAAGAFGDADREQAAQLIEDVVIPEGIEEIEGLAFEQTPCNITFGVGCTVKLDADAFKASGATAVTFDGDATQVSFDEGAFAGASFIESVIFNGKADTSKAYGDSNPAAFYPVSFYEAAEGDAATDPVAVLVMKAGCDPLNPGEGDVYGGGKLPTAKDGFLWAYAKDFDTEAGVTQACSIYQVPKDSLSGAAVTLSAKAFTYSGKAKAPSVQVKLGSTVLKQGSDYTVFYKDNVAVGTAKVTVIGTGNYVDSKTLSFTINPKGTKISKLAKGKKKVKVKWKKQASQTSGYQIRYSLKKSMKSAKSLSVKKVKTTSKVVKKLKSKKKYYFQIRTFKKVGGKTYVSAWSAKKSVKVK